MNELIVFLTILIITAIGYTVIRGFNLLPTKNQLFIIACSFGLGVGLTACQLYIYSRLGIPWHNTVLLLPWLLLACSILVKKRKVIRIALPALPKLRPIDTFLLLAILAACGYTLFEAVLRPVSVWDAWAIWLLQSKIFFLNGSIQPSELQYANVEYPLIVSLLGTFVYLVLGHVDDTAVLLTAFTFYAFLGLLLFSVLKRRYGTTYALLFTFLYATTQNFIRHGGRLEAGQADLPLGYFMFICAILLLRYMKKHEKKTLLLLSLFLAITGLTKFDGQPFVIIVDSLAAYRIFQLRLFSHLPLLLISVIPILEWRFYTSVVHIAGSLTAGQTVQFSLPIAVEAFRGAFLELVNIKSWNLLWVIYFFTLFAFSIRRKPELIVLDILILSQLAFYVFLYIFFPGLYKPSNSISRLLIHLAPMAFLHVAIQMRRLDTKFVKKILFSKQAKDPGS
jgi:hypothetical protein